MLRLVELPDLERFAVYHMEGHWDPDGLALAEAIRQAAGRPDLPFRRFPWPIVRLLAPVVPLFRELAEMRYLWQLPVRMTNEARPAPRGRTAHAAAGGGAGDARLARRGRAGCRRGQAGRLKEHPVSMPTSGGAAANSDHVP